jgi:peptidoglycan hydrolase-like protein with peptidoglycan-binding domain
LGAIAASAGLLMSAPVAAAQSPQLTGLLALGAKGSTVTAVQSALHIRKTGEYGKSTKKAVVHYQADKGLEVDGVVGPQTWDTLFHITPPAPAPAPVAPTTSTTTTTTSSYTSGGYSIPSSIVQCESGGNWGAVNAGSGAGGAYQILPSTWAAYGGTGSPQDASPAEQSAIAARIYAAQGSSAWSC